MIQKSLLFIIITALSSICFGQTDYSRGEIFGGYSNNQIETGNPNNTTNFNTGNNFREFFNKRESFNGFEVSGVVNVNRYVGIKGDISGTYKTYNVNIPNSPTSNTTTPFEVEDSLYNFLGGVQIKDNSRDGSRLRPFGHAMIGAARGKTKIDANVFTSPFCSRVGADCRATFRESDTGFAAAIGGGLDVRVNERFSVRAFQVDYNPTNLNDRRQDNVRFGFGVVFH